MEMEKAREKCFLTAMPRIDFVTAQLISLFWIVNDVIILIPEEVEKGFL